MSEESGPLAADWMDQLQRGVQAAAQRRDEWAASLDVLASGLAALSDSDEWKVRRRSAAAKDRDADDVVIGGRTEPFAGMLRYEACLNIRSVADHMQGLAVLVRAERSVLGSAAIARGMFEAAVWGAALLDSSVDQRERLRRLLMRRAARLMAVMREAEMMQASGAEAEAVTREVDEHGSHLDPAEEVDAIEAAATALGWKVKRRYRTLELDDRLTVDDLVPTLGKAIGVEEYVWRTGSAMFHGEHSPMTAAWGEIVQTMDGFAPAWLIQHNCMGSWAGPRVLLATFESYTGRTHLGQEFVAMSEAFWKTTVQK
jgi:hypothetical protein